MSKIVEKVKEEFIGILPAVIFFFCALHIVALVRSLMLENANITVAETTSIIVTALILGKVVLIADLIPLMNRYHHKPLIFNIAWKGTIYVAVASVLRVLERIIEEWRASGSLGEAYRNAIDHMKWPHFWALLIVLSVFLLTYCTMHELTRVLGKDNRGRGKLRTIFFGAPETA